MIPVGTHRQRAVIVTVLFSTVLLLVGELVFTGCAFPVSGQDMDQWNQTRDRFKQAFVNAPAVREVLAKRPSKACEVFCFANLISVHFGQATKFAVSKDAQGRDIKFPVFEQSLTYREFKMLVVAAQEVSRSLRLNAEIVLHHETTKSRSSVRIGPHGDWVDWNARS